MAVAVQEMEDAPSTPHRLQPMSTFDAVEDSETAAYWNSVAMATEVSYRIKNTFINFEILPPPVLERSRSDPTTAISLNSVANVEVPTTHQSGSHEGKSTQLEASVAAAVREACEAKFLHCAQMKEKYGESFLGMGRRMEAWIETHYALHETGHMIVGQLGEVTKPNEEHYYAAILTFCARINGFGTRHEEGHVRSKQLVLERVHQLKALYLATEERRLHPLINVMDSSVYRDNQNCNKKVRPRTPDPLNPSLGKGGGKKRTWETEVAEWRSKWREIDGVRKLQEMAIEEDVCRNAWHEAKNRLNKRLPHDQEKQLEEAKKLLKAWMAR
jgi:hypothetical protein